MVASRIAGEKTVGKNRVWMEKGPFRARAAFSVTNIFVLAPGDQYNTAQSRLRSGHGLCGESRPSKGLQPISRKVWKNGLCMKTNFS